MDIKALIKKYEEYENGLFDFGARVACKHFLKDLEQLDEQKSVKVPQFVAEWIEEARKACKDVAELFEFDFTNDEVRKWFMQERPFDLVARAWLDGYEVEEEKRYRVKIKGLAQNKSYLNFNLGGVWLFGDEDYFDGYRTHHARKELEEAGFGWVFDCEGIEIEEVEG